MALFRAFSADVWNRPDKIVCCDANFTQKCRKGQSDHDNWAWFHPDTVFISESKVAEMEQQVAAWRANGRAEKLDSVLLPEDTWRYSSRNTSTPQREQAEGLNVLTLVRSLDFA